MALEHDRIFVSMKRDIKTFQPLAWKIENALKFQPPKKQASSHKTLNQILLALHHMEITISFVDDVIVKMCFGLAD